MFPLLRKGEVSGGNLFVFRFIKNSTHGNRFCFSVSKKVSKKAVMRNKMRRAGYRFLSDIINDIKPDTLGIFSFKRVPKDNKEIEDSLNSILKKEKLIK